MTRAAHHRLVAIGLALAAGSALGCGDARDEPAEAPDYSAITLDGDSVSLAALRGDAVLLNVWATWCAPCRREIPELEALHQRFGDQGLRVVGVTVDSRTEEAEIRRFIDDFDMTFDIWWDPDQRVLSAFEAMGVPLTVLIGPDGRIRWSHLGALVPDDPGLRDAIERLLPTARPQPAAMGQPAARTAGSTEWPPA